MPDHRHFILHKPVGYLSQFIFNQTKRKNKKLLGELHPFPEGTMAIGRLDKNSEGLLLLTTNGRVSEQIRSKSIDKEYYAEVDGDITVDKIRQLAQGIAITIYGKPYTTLPCKVTELDPGQLTTLPITIDNDKRHRPTSWISITMTEGKFRQVRKMTAAIALPTLRLIRVRVGAVQLGKLGVGEVLEVKDLGV